MQADVEVPFSGGLIFTDEECGLYAGVEHHFLEALRGDSGCS
jgi:hypothetical protein